jgi:hypothetical protein
MTPNVSGTEVAEERGTFALAGSDRWTIALFLLLRSC